jgi:hypothetical protein
MKALQFTPVMRDAAGGGPHPLAIAESPGTDSSYILHLGADGALTATPIEPAGDLNISDGGAGTPIAALRFCGGLATPSWGFVTGNGGAAINGSAPLPSAVLEPGDLLAFGDRVWHVSSLWQPEPLDAPDELRDKPCPVCGGELGLAPVVQCGCGRWTHLENAAEPNDKDALNCFLAATTCGGCGRSAALEPQMFPEVPDVLAIESVDENEVGS